MHNFNFPNISFVEQLNLEGNTSSSIIIPYHMDDEQIILPNEQIKKIINSDNIINILPKKTGETFSFFDHDKYFIFVNVKKDSFEKNIVSALKKVPESITNINVFADSYNFYDKLLVSKTIFELKCDWTAKTKKQEQTQKNISFIIKAKQKVNLNYGKALAECQSLVQQLVNMPANYLTPTKFVEIVSQYIDDENLDDISLTVYGKKEIKKMGMGAFYGVAKGSNEDPQLIVLQYNNSKKDEKPIVLVGKGLTFDSGGISIKPSNGMADMKGDMAGAATALGAVMYAAKAQLPINLVAIAACCENMPSGKSLKPGDVVTAMNGTTIEVIDTDAEGRLVLADALEFSKKFEGKYTIDMATLTGACIVALGHIHTGVFTKEDKLAAKLIKSGKKIEDVSWQLPLDDAHEEMLESKVADISNLCLGKGAGAQNGAIFLQKFAPKEGWCHLDIAGTSAIKGGGATSRPLAMISEFLDQC